MRELLEDVQGVSELGWSTGGQQGREEEEDREVQDQHVWLHDAKPGSSSEEVSDLRLGGEESFPFNLLRARPGRASRRNLVQQLIKSGV